MNALAPLWVRIVVFLLWPVIAPILLAVIALVFVLLWIPILFCLTLKID